MENQNQATGYYTIEIEPIKVLTFPTDVYGSKLMIGEVKVIIPDNGVNLRYWLLDNENRIIFDGGYINLTNDEISNWTDSDSQLMDSVLLKLNLTKKII